CYNFRIYLLALAQVSTETVIKHNLGAHAHEKYILCALNPQIHPSLQHPPQRRTRRDVVQSEGHPIKRVLGVREGERKSGESDATAYSGTTRGLASKGTVARVKSIVSGSFGSTADDASGDDNTQVQEPPDKDAPEPEDHEHEREQEHSSMAESTEQGPPHGGSFELQGNALVAQ
ncbi:predicted protein, partial [Postia placenta Mad-698-R]